jgi:hypothetical protein
MLIATLCNNTRTAGRGFFYDVRAEAARVEAGSNASTVALRVVGGEVKGIHCPGVQLGHPVPGGICVNTGT